MKYGLAAIAAMMAASPALATTQQNPLTADSVVLDLRGLDLTSVAGQQRLAIRMDAAANAVCGEGMSTIHLALAAQARACHADVLADIRTRIASSVAARRGGGTVQLALR